MQVPGKSYRSRHNKSCQGLTKTKTLESEARTEDPLKNEDLLQKKRRNGRKYVNSTFLYAVIETKKRSRNRCMYVISPVLSTFPSHHVFHCTWDALLEELPGSLISKREWVFGFRYISYTQLIADIDAINFVFLFSTFCQLSRLTFISNRINEGVSGKPTNLNWPPHTSGVKYIPENPSIESPKLHAFLETLEMFRSYFGCPFPGTVSYL